MAHLAAPGPAHLPLEQGLLQLPLPVPPRPPRPGRFPLRGGEWGDGLPPLFQPGRPGPGAGPGAASIPAPGVAEQPSPTVPSAPRTLPRVSRASGPRCGPSAALRPHPGAVGQTDGGGGGPAPPRPAAGGGGGERFQLLAGNSHPGADARGGGGGLAQPGLGGAELKGSWPPSCATSTQAGPPSWTGRFLSNVPKGRTESRNFVLQKSIEESPRPLGV